MYSLPVTTQYFDLDPHYTDLYGDPLTRITIDGIDTNNFNSSAYISPLIADIFTKMGANNVTTIPGVPNSHTIGLYGYHVRGGTRMGVSSSTSVLNMYQQSWTASNYFTTGESAGTSGDNITAGTHTIGPQAYLAAEGIQMYLKSPGELVTST